jgi:hypothetical protein
MANILPRQAPGFDPSILTPEYMAFDNSHEIKSIVAVFTALALFIVIARFYVRIFMLRVFGPDDWSLLFAAVCAAPFFYCCGADNLHRSCPSRALCATLDDGTTVWASISMPGSWFLAR